MLINFIVFHPIGPPYLGRKRKVIYRKIYIVLFISFISLIVKALYGSIATVILAVVFTCFHSTELTIFFILAVTGLIKYTLLSSCYYIFSAVYTYIPYSAPRSTLKSFNVHSHSSVTMINKRFYTTDVKDSTLPPNWVTGFVDAEGSFSLSEPELNPYWVTGFCDAESSFNFDISKNSTSKSGRNIIPEFSINLHLKDILLLRKIHSFFVVGIIYYNDVTIYSVKSLRDINDVIIPHFEKYPLITQKKADYLIFKQIINLLNLRVHFYNEGVKQILSLKASMNLGLSERLKIQFPTVVPEPRPVVSFQGIPDPHWLTGFVDGDGCFYVNIKKTKLRPARAGTVSGFQVIVSFYIYQHVRDELLLTKLLDYLKCGRIDKAPSTKPQGIVRFTVLKLSDIIENIIPFFQSYSLQGIKYRDYIDFCKIVDIMKNKSHLTPEGLNKIKSLKSGMNTGKVYDQ